MSEMLEGNGVSPDKELKLPPEIWHMIYAYTCLQGTYEPRIIQVVEEEITQQAGQSSNSHRFIVRAPPPPVIFHLNRASRHWAFERGQFRRLQTRDRDCPDVHYHSLYDILFLNVDPNLLEVFLDWQLGMHQLRSIAVLKEGFTGFPYDLHLEIETLLVADWELGKIASAPFSFQVEVEETEKLRTRSKFITKQGIIGGKGPDTLSVCILEEAHRVPEEARADKLPVLDEFNKEVVLRSDVMDRYNAFKGQRLPERVSSARLYQALGHETYYLGLSQLQFHQK